MKIMNKNDLMNVVLVGKSPKLQQILSYYTPYGYNSGVFGWNWDCYRNYDYVNMVNFDLLVYNRNLPKNSIDIDIILNEMTIEFTGMYFHDRRTACEYLIKVVKILKERGVL